LSPSGLGWEGESNAFRDFHFITNSIAVGLAWRPTCSVSIAAKIAPVPQSFKLPNGETGVQMPGMLFARYSPDQKNWSTWQAVPLDPTFLKEKKELLFRVQLLVPDLERSEYGKLLEQYSTMNVPWGSDENAAVKWILVNDPDFFKRHIPFIGYIQFLYENSLSGTQRLQSFDAIIGFCVGGTSMAPKDGKTRQPLDEPWNFKGK